MAEAAATPVEGDGIGITGPVDVVTGIVSQPLAPGRMAADRPAKPFADAFGVPVAIDNDANVAAVGEWWLGAGRGTRRMTMVTIGTGIGVATLIEGKLRPRFGRRAWGSRAHGPQSVRRAMLLRRPRVLGGAGIRAQRSIVAQAAAGGGGLLRELAGGQPELATGEHLFAAAMAGDNAARDIIDSIATWWGLGLVNLASTAMPDMFVLSGGVIGDFEFARARVVDVLERHSAIIPTRVPVDRDPG